MLFGVPLVLLRRPAPLWHALMAPIWIGSVFAAPINLNTGTATWTGSGPNVAGTVAAVTLGASPNAAWLPAPVGSQWISTRLDDGTLPLAVTALPGTYIFQFAFTTPGLGGSLNFVVAADNSVIVEVFLDNVLVAPAYIHPGNSLVNPDPSPGSLGCSFLPAGSNICQLGVAAGLVGPGTINFGAGGAGAIVIRATVVNSTPPDPSPVGFLLTGTAAVVDIPEPASYALFGFSGVAFLIARRRHR
jgi:hypothetical protein